MDNEAIINGLIESSRYMRELYNMILARAAAQCGITHPEADVLLFLRNNPEYNTARDIAYYRGFSKAYVSKAVEPLMQRGYISIRTDPADRRRQLLTITGGNDVAQRLHMAQVNFIELIMRDIPRGDAAKFIEICSAMCANARAASAEFDER